MKCIFAFHTSGSYPAKQLFNDQFRDKWFKEISSKLITYKIDGLHLDYNQPIRNNDKKKDKLTELVKFISERLANQNAEFSFAVPW